MTATRTRDREATEQGLLDAVSRLLTRQGFEALGVNAVAREAEVDKVLIYRYFDGMDGLLRAFAHSETFWPSVEEVLGQGPDDLRTMAPADRWATGLVRYAQALRRRPIIREVLAWEQVDKNEFTEILRLRREAWFAELLAVLPDDTAETDVDPVAMALVVAPAIHYLIARGRLHDDFNGLDVATDEGWRRIEEIVQTMIRRTIASSGSAIPDSPADTTDRTRHG